MPASRPPLFALAAVPVLALVAIVVVLLLAPGSRPTDIAALLSASPEPTPTLNGSSTDGATTPPGEAPTDPPTGQPTDGPGSTPDASGGIPPKDGGAGSVAPEDLEGYIWPVRNAFVTSRFQQRDLGFVVIDGEEYHDGLDLASSCGDRVRAAHSGTVLYAGRNFDPYIGYKGDASRIYARLERLGRTNEQPIVVVIDDGNSYRSIYVHLSRSLVEQGAIVEAGDFIGVEGMTGLATGCHLHYGLIRMDGEWQQVLPRLTRFGYPPLVRERVDPLDVLDWTDEFAPEKLRNRVLGTPSPAPQP
ncbi:MAG TPA: M23 family metallopeptidase [Candidatus Limnocylindrales bacterium]|nr:M23 family metallopeptidase [Candidatus Limnocylindrales bacterium]